MRAQDFSREETLLWLGHLDIFEDVPPEELELLLEDAAWIELRSGDSLLADPADRDVYLVRYGSLGSTLMGPGGVKVELAPSGPGEILGEISAIAGVRRPTDVVALRHCGLLRIAGRAFETFLERSHRGTLQVTRHLAKALLGNLQAKPRSVRPDGIVLVAVAEGIDLMAIAETLVRDAEAHGLASTWLSIEDRGLSAAEIAAAHMLNDFTVMVTSGVDAAWDAQCIASADRLLYVDAAGRPPLPEPPLREILGSGRQARIDVATLTPDTGAPPEAPRRWTGRGDVAMHVHIREGRVSDLEFLGRIVGGRAVGLVLKGGGAKGFAHLGAIRALREAGIPIDLVGGTSMGAIIGAGVAFEWRDDELMERMHQVFCVSNPVDDYTVPLIAITRGRKVSLRLQHHFGARTIESAWRPFFAVSTNLSTCGLHVHTSGPLWRALRATSALPGILPPMVEDGDVLVDGSVMNNFPIDIMRDLHRGPVIGVDLAEDDSFNSAIADFEMTGAYRRLRERARHPVHMFNVMTRTATASSLAHDRMCRGLADLLIEPDVSDVGVLHWTRLKATAERAYRHTLEQLEREAVTYDSLLAGSTPD